MSRQRTNRRIVTTQRAAPAAELPYAESSKRPLPVLLFLLPLIALYEYGTLRYLSGGERGVVEVVSAKAILAEAFDIAGVASLHLPAVLLVTVLLVWHLVQRDPWKVRAGTLLGMALEAALWTLPLLIGGLVFFGGVKAMALAGPVQVEAMPWQARLTLSIGAGLYEEMLFRLIALSGLHFVLVDLMRIREKPANAAAVVISAVGFAFYHNLSLTGGGVSASLFAFYLLAGIFFGWLFLARGLGIVAATHALYDAVVLLTWG